MDTSINLEGMQGRITDSGVVSFQNDSRVNVVFYKKSVLDHAKSKAQGRPIHTGRDYVRIQQPGEKDYIDRPVDDDPIVMQRWPNQWAAYQRNQQPTPTGTPIELLFPQMPETSANLKTLGVHTIEQMAHLTAEGLTQVGMGATQWSNKAKEYIRQSKAGVGFHEMNRQLEQRDNKIEVLERQMAELRRERDAERAKNQGVPPEMIPRERRPYMPPDRQLAALPPSAFGPEGEDELGEDTAEDLGESVPDAQGFAPPPDDQTFPHADDMDRSQLFAFLRANGVHCGRETTDELRAKARLVPTCI